MTHTRYAFIKANWHADIVDQGTADKFLPNQLLPQAFVEACAKSETELELRMQDGYDHGYYFIQSFVAEHLAFHAQRLVA